MLQRLSIRHIALIEALDLEFSPGFSVVTGETGAGKSILLESMSLALGERAEARLLRHGQPQGSVAAEFHVTNHKALAALLEEQGIAFDGTLLFRRVLYADGKSRAFINDEPVSLNIMKAAGEMLVEIHGQHGQRGLLDVSTHLESLDDYGKLATLRAEIATAWKDWQQHEKSFQVLAAEIEENKREEDYLRAVYAEIQALDPKLNEEEALVEKRTLLQHREKFLRTIGESLKELTGSRPVADAIAAAERYLIRSTVPMPDSITNVTEALNRAHVEVSEAVAGLEGIIEESEAKASTLEQVDDRLYALKGAARKFGIPVSELAFHKAEIGEKLKSIATEDHKLKELKAQIAESKTLYCEKAKLLRQKRTKAAAMLEKAIMAELKPLKMEHSRFEVEIKELPEEGWGPGGTERVQFLVSTNPGSPFAPMHKIASGGELSRFMLALKVALADVITMPVMIFDEIDTGVGGAVADAIGKRLALLGQIPQVLSVTHHPQVAALAQHHLFIEKKAQKDGTVVMVHWLNEKEKEEELARMLSGASVTEASRAAAVSLRRANR